MLQNIPKDHFVFTSESVTNGHPDKLCDYISDSILDACLEKDPDSYVACETAVKNNMCVVMGELHTKANIIYEQVIRQAICDVGYDDIAKGCDYKHETIIIALDKQSPDIAQSVHINKNPEDIGAGDQGLMIGYASNETKECMPLSHLLASKICQRITECRAKNIVNWMRPDAKSQVTVEYKVDGKEIKVVRVHTILISCQHIPQVSQEQIHSDLREHVINKVIDSDLIDARTIFHLNPSGKFEIGGPTGDCGLTGRKIIVDTYGGWGGHGGGAFSGKDCSKVDRSGAYAVRWVAKSLVAGGFCSRVVVQVSYSIGITEPLSIYVDTYGTVKEGFTDDDLRNIVLRNFDLRPGYIIKNLQLKRPIFKKTSAFGHFGREDPDFTWEKPVNLDHEKTKQQ